MAPARLNRAEPEKESIGKTVFNDTMQIVAWFINHPLLLFVLGIILFVVLCFVFVGPTQAGQVYNAPVTSGGLY